MTELGWVKLWRKSLDSDVFQNPKVFMFWCYCLMKASHKEYNALVGYQQVPLKPGQFIFGLKKAKKESGLSIQTLRTCLKCLVNLGNLTTKPTTKYSLISVVNWEVYQSDKISSNTQTNKQLTIKQHSTNNQLTTYKNGENGENGKKTITPQNLSAKNFEIFYESYPRKVAKPKALKAFEKLNLDENVFAEILKRLQSQFKDTEPKFIPHPATYLNQRRWEDGENNGSKKETTGSGLLEKYDELLN